MASLARPSFERALVIALLNALGLRVGEAQADVIPSQFPESGIDREHYVFFVDMGDTLPGTEIADLLKDYTGMLYVFVFLGPRRPETEQAVEDLLESVREELDANNRRIGKRFQVIFSPVDASEVEDLAKFVEGLATKYYALIREIAPTIIPHSITALRKRKLVTFRDGDVLSKAMLGDAIKVRTDIAVVTADDVADYNHITRLLVYVAANTLEEIGPDLQAKLKEARGSDGIYSQRLLRFLIQTRLKAYREARRRLAIAA